MASLQNLLVKHNPCKFLILPKATYIFRGLSVFCFSKLNLKTAWGKESPWNLCIVHAYDNVKGSCVLCIDNELQEFPTKNTRATPLNWNPIILPDKSLWLILTSLQMAYLVYWIFQWDVCEFGKIRPSIPWKFYPVL